MQRTCSHVSWDDPRCGALTANIDCPISLCVCRRLRFVRYWPQHFRVNLVVSSGYLSNFFLSAIPFLVYNFFSHVNGEIEEEIELKIGRIRSISSSRIEKIPRFGVPDCESSTSI